MLNLFKKKSSGPAGKLFGHCLSDLCPDGQPPKPIMVNIDIIIVQLRLDHFLNHVSEKLEIARVTSHTRLVTPANLGKLFGWPLYLGKPRKRFIQYFFPIQH